MQEIKVNSDKVELSKNGNILLLIPLGSDQISDYGFQVVDHIVEELLLAHDQGVNIQISVNSIESRMIARKLEDKITDKLTIIENV